MPASISSAAGGGLTVSSSFLQAASRSKIANIAKEFFNYSNPINKNGLSRSLCIPFQFYA